MTKPSKKIQSNSNEDSTKVTRTTSKKAKSNKTTPANKRNRSELSSPDTPLPPSKTIVTMSSPPLTLDSIRLVIAEQTESLQSSMKTLGDGIKAEIAQIHQKIDANQANIQSQINELKSNVEKCMEQTTDSDDDIQRVSKLNELKINGIAHADNQNLNEIFGEIAKLVEFDLSNVNNVPTVMRVFKKDHAAKTSAPTSIVIVKFVANHIRNDFYSHYLKKIAAKQPIMSENIGLPKGTRIIIGENLTAKNFAIFIEASKLKRENKLCTVFTQDGLVQVKANKNTKATAIRSPRQLESFIIANPPTATTSTTAAANEQHNHSESTLMTGSNNNGDGNGNQQQQQQQVPMQS